MLKAIDKLSVSTFRIILVGCIIAILFLGTLISDKQLLYAVAVSLVVVYGLLIEAIRLRFIGIGILSVAIFIAFKNPDDGALFAPISAIGLLIIIFSSFGGSLRLASFISSIIFACSLLGYSVGVGFIGSYANEDVMYGALGNLGWILIWVVLGFPVFWIIEKINPGIYESAPMPIRRWETLFTGISLSLVFYLFIPNSFAPRLSPTLTLNGYGTSIFCARCVAFSPDDATLAVGSYSALYLFDPTDGTRIQMYENSSERGSICSVAYSPDGTELIVGEGNSIAIWDIKTGYLLHTLRASESSEQNGRINVIYSPDGKMLASSDHNIDGYFLLWDPETGEKLAAISTRRRARIYGMGFSRDGSTLAVTTGCNCPIDVNLIDLWDIESKVVTRSLEGHTMIIRSISFSPNGNILASGSDDRMIILWDIQSGNQIKTLQGHNRAVNTIEFSPDGKILASGSEDRTIILWDVQSGEPIMILKGHTDNVISLAFSNDGTKLVSVAEDDNVNIWDVSAAAHSLSP